MQNRLLKIAILIGFLGLSSCDKIDIRSAFLSYQNVDERFDDSMKWNDKHPTYEITTSDTNYQIFIMGDSHIGSTKNFNLFVNDALQSNALALMMLGDITTGNSEDYNTLEQNIPNQDSIASFLIVGNHDLYFNGWKEFYARFGSSTYYFTVKTPNDSDLYICLDSGSGTLGNKQANWLKDVLKQKRGSYRNCIVCTHCNFFRSRHTGSTNPVVEELQLLMDLFHTYNVNLVITGHDHEKSLETLGNTTYITMDALLDGFDQAGYLQLHIDELKPDFEFINF